MNESTPLDRRSFLKMGAGFALGTGFFRYGAYGAPGITEANIVEKYARLIPATKGLDPNWVRSLTARGTAHTYSDPKALDHIGMPVGGLFAGTVYLGGDGRLWLWNICNDDSEGITPRHVEYKGRHIRMRDGANYVSPTKRIYPFEQRFGIRINGALHPLDAEGFKKIAFTGQYPIGEVSYEDPTCPIQAKLTAFSPFIPMNTADSSLPAIIMSYTLKNTGDTKVDCDMVGWLENPVFLSTKKANTLRTSAVVHEKGFTALNCTGLESSEEGLSTARDHGSMVLAVLTNKSDSVIAEPESEKGKYTGSVGQKLTLEPGEERTVDFVITWHFPNLTAWKMQGVGREYAARFDDALGVAHYVANDFQRLSGDTKLWRDTWYDSTLPYWFLDRTMANTSILATTTAYRFRDGRFWAWEGIGCCEGTCTHVWHYAQAPGRLFPDVERRHREEVDFGIAMHENGGIGMRANLKEGNHAADDGQCGRILGAYREHQMSSDDEFLKRNWPKIKKAIRFLINRDKNRTGILSDAQHNTLDAAWYGRISFLATLYLAALRAGEAMATEMGDTSFAHECKSIADQGAKTILELYNGEYFFHELDPNHVDHVAVGTGCYIDQVFGQFWAHQLGLGYLFDKEKTLSALKALYKYNFVPHIGRFRDTFTRGRWYAMDDDKGLIMCTWPKGGLNEKWHKAWQFGYFNECMTGFEWQAAAHMISEGLVEEGMAVSRAIHDRYGAERRNPYNEIECSDHYSRAMASYGAFLAACGYESHGPKGYLGFSPKVFDGDTFKCAFTAAGGWGTFEQRKTNQEFVSSLQVNYGSISLKSLGLDLPERSTAPKAALDGTEILFSLETLGNKQRLVFDKAITLSPGKVLTIHA